MNKPVFILAFVFAVNGLYAQPIEDVNMSNDSIIYKELPNFILPKDFQRQYRRSYTRLKKVYPLALYTKELVYQMDKELAEMESKKEIRKYKKHTQEELKKQFTYVLKDLYTTEGELLMKLIHRETGLTVSEILHKYKGGLQAEIYESIAKLWGQNMDSKYDPDGEDWIIEILIAEINAKEIPFNYEPRILSKEEFKKTQKEYKQLKKDTKKRDKLEKKEEKKKNRI